MQTSAAASAEFIALTRHRIPDLSVWLPIARAALAPLTSQHGCLGGEICAAIDDPQLMTVITRWESVGAYRRALSAFDVKANSIPFLSTAIDEPSAFEVLHHNGPDGAQDFSSARAADADTIRLRDAASGDVPPRA
jgi:hypothetical protein